MSDLGRYDDTDTYDSPGFYDGVGTLPSTVVTVGLLLNGVLTDITPYVRLDQGVKISRGRPNESSAPNTATCTLTVDNADGRFSPKNTSGPYFPYLTLGTILVVRVGSKNRFVGAVYEWPAAWVGNDINRTVQIVANGPRRRLQRSGALYSPWRRLMQFNASNALQAYWPCEDGAGSTSFAAYLGGGAGGSGSASYAADSSFPGSAPLPTMAANDEWDFNPAPFTVGTTGQTVMWNMKSSGGAGKFQMVVYPLGSLIWTFLYDPTANTIELRWQDRTTGGISTTGAGALPGPYVAGDRWIVALELFQSGSVVNYAIIVYRTGDSLGVGFSGNTVAAATVGPVYGISAINGPAPQATTVGHVALFNSTVVPGTAGISAFAGWSGETAAARIFRIANEETIGLQTVGSAKSTVLGVQGEESAIDLIDEAAFAEDSVSSEMVDNYGLYYRPYYAMQAQAPSISVARSDLLPGSFPVYDDQLIANDVTATRKGGSTARVTQAAGNMGTAAVGAYQANVTINIQKDINLPLYAGQLLSEGTMDEPRMPAVTFDWFNMAAPPTFAAITGMREGDTIQLTGMTGAEGMTSPVSYLLTGWTEQITDVSWTFTLVTQPSPIVRAFILNDATYGTIDTTNRIGRD